MTLAARISSVAGCFLAAFFTALQMFVVVENHARPDRPVELSLILSTLAADVGALVLAAVATLILFRYPRQPIAWIMLALSFTWAVSFISPDYTQYALITHPGSLPFGSLMASISTWGYTVNLLLLFWLVMLFPDGKLDSGWRAVSGLATAGLVSVGIITALAPGPSGASAVPNPLGIWTAPGVVNVITSVPAFLAFPAGAAAVIWRFRRTRGDERQQIKWFAFGAAIAMIVMAIAILFGWNGFVLFLGVAALTFVPVTVGIAILRYRLYDIDLVINRTLVYGSLTVSLAAVYVGGVIALQAGFRALTGQSSQLAVAIATLTVAALFNPWRRALQDFIDRRFYRHRYDAARTLAKFQSTLRDQVDAEQLSNDIVAVVVETLQPSSLSVWLRNAGVGGTDG